MCCIIGKMITQRTQTLLNDALHLFALCQDSRMKCKRLYGHKGARRSLGIAESRWSRKESRVHYGASTAPQVPRKAGYTMVPAQPLRPQGKQGTLWCQHSPPGSKESRVHYGASTRLQESCELLVEHGTPKSARYQETQECAQRA